MPSVVVHMLARFPVTLCQTWSLVDFGVDFPLLAGPLLIRYTLSLTVCVLRLGVPALELPLQTCGDTVVAMLVALLCSAVFGMMAILLNREGGSVGGHCRVL